MRWFCLGGMGFLVLVLFCWYVFVRKQSFDSPLLGLLTLGLVFLGIAIIQPDYIKYAGLELKKAKEEANEAAKLALESSAVSIWNQGRFGGGVKNQEGVAKKLLSQVYGEKTVPVMNYFQHQGLLLTPQDELKSVPKGIEPSEADSPLFRLFLKSSSEKKNIE